jgi:hypothetical protein
VAFWAPWEVAALFEALVAAVGLEARLASAPRRGTAGWCG